MEVASRIPPVTTLAAVTADLASLLKPGQAIQARVQQILGEGLYRLATVRGAFDVASPTPLPVGSAVSLTLAEAGGQTTLRIALPAGQGSTPGAAAPAPLPGQAAAPLPAGLAALSQGTPALPSSSGATPSPPASTSGAPREAGAASSLPITPNVASAAPLPDGALRPAPAPPAPQGPLFAAIASSLSRQDGLGPLVASLAALAARPRGEVPPPARAALERLEGLRLDAGQGVTPEAVEAALERSGVLLETRLARGAPPQPQGDLKALLIALRDDLRALLPSPEAADGETTLPRSERPPPPMRGEPPAAQKVGPPPALPAGQADVARLLLGQTEAGLARLRLAQFASLGPEPVGAEGVRVDPPPAALHATIPIALGRETALLDMVVEREPDRRGPAEALAPSWRVWLALDIDPAGPVTALITFGGADRAVGVTFWAEREATERALAAALPGLRNALSAAELAVGETAARAGRPRRVTRSGRFLDTTT